MLVALLCHVQKALNALQLLLDHSSTKRVVLPLRITERSRARVDAEPKSLQLRLEMSEALLVQRAPVLHVPILGGVPLLELLQAFLDCHDLVLQLPAVPLQLRVI